jgi:hypothetical protein
LSMCLGQPWHAGDEAKDPNTTTASGLPRNAYGELGWFFERPIYFAPHSE